MAIEIKAPQFPESIADGSVATWHKSTGDHVEQDELLVDIETDKVVLEVVAPADGVLGEILTPEGDTVESQQLMAHFEAGGAAQSDKSSADVKSQDQGKEKPASSSDSRSTSEHDANSGSKDSKTLGPAVRKLLDEKGLSASDVKGTGPQGRITKDDVNNHKAPAAKSSTPSQSPASNNQDSTAPAAGARTEKRVAMTRLRAKVAERLMDAKNNTAMLTTFNEVNMQPVMAMRKKYKDAFEKKHDVKLGFMSFFVKAAAEALKRFPEVNASIDGKELVYHGYCDIGVAVSSNRGLVVPVLRDTEHKNFAEIESEIVGYGTKARDGKLTIDEMTGGTFTISNGGVFGSLMSTPILNPPQTAILGMHKIQERPMAVNGQVVILPMMYLALSYDHRMVDGKEAVQFLVAIKEMVEDPARLLLAV